MKSKKMIIFSFITLTLIAMSAHPTFAREKESGGKLTSLTASVLAIDAILNRLYALSDKDADILSITLGNRTAEDGRSVYEVRYRQGEAACLKQYFLVSTSSYIDTDHPEKGIYKHATPTGQHRRCR